jgi:hypothetical protein
MLCLAPMSALAHTDNSAPVRLDPRNDCGPVQLPVLCEMREMDVTPLVPRLGPMGAMGGNTPPHRSSGYFNFLLEG